jgi:diguanylate cyclase (GGDEF)-like protein
MGHTAPPTRIRFLGVLALLFGLVFSAPAVADDLVVSRAVLDDPSGALSIADVAERAFTPIEGATLFGGVTNSTYWLRLRVRAPAGGGSVVLFIVPTYLNDVRLFEAGPGAPQDWATRATGNRHPYAERDRKRASLGFVVTPAAPESTYYLRLATRGYSQMNVKALVPQEAEAKDDGRDLMMVFFVTAMVALLLWALQGYLLDRQPIFALFALHQAVYTLFGIAATGYLAPLSSAAAWPSVVDWSFTVLYFGIAVTPLLFSRALFTAYDPPRWLMHGFTLVLGAIPVELAAVVLGHGNAAIIINALVIKLSWVYFVVLAFTLRKEQSPSRRVLQVFFIAITATNVMFWLTNNGVLSDNKENLDGLKLLIADGLVIGGLFAVMLHTRGRQLRRDAQKSMLGFLLIQEKLALEQKLKEQIEAQARTDDLTGVFNRRHFVELAERELERARRYDRPFTLLMIDIDHFKAINDTRGHSTGDVALQGVARVIGETLRGSDIFGRLGGEEFAVALVETGRAEAAEVARRICAAVAETEIASPKGGPVRLTVSIGMTQLDGRNIGFDAVLNEADQAMYAAKQAGRNRVIVNA